MPKPLITFMFKGLGNGLLRKLFFSLSVDLLFKFFPLSGDCFFVCEEWNIFSIEGALLFNSGRIFCQLRKDVFWIEKGSIIILRNDIIVFFYRGFVFVERGFIWFTGIFLRGDSFFLMFSYWMNTLEANVCTITFSTPSPVIHRHSIVSQVAAKRPGCKGLLEWRIHGEMDEIAPDNGRVLKPSMNF